MLQFFAMMLLLLASPGDAERNVVETEIKIPLEDAGVTLGCTLTIPAGEGMFPGAVLLTVAGPNDRDQTLFQHKGFADLAHGLAIGGVASLRCDDRGVGGSDGVYFDATYGALASQALAQLRALAAQPTIDAHRVGFVGNSEGGAIGPLAATRSEDAAFVVLLAGPGVPGSETLRIQLEAALAELGIGEERAASLREAYSRFLEIQAGATSDPATREAMRSFLEAGGRSLFPPYGFVPGDLDGLTDYVLSPWHRSMIAYDPAVPLRQLEVPVLALAGDKDRGLDPKFHLVSIREALKENPQATIELIPGLNHLFQTAVTGAVAEYPMLAEAISPSVARRVASWIRGVTD